MGKVIVYFTLISLAILSLGCTPEPPPPPPPPPVLPQYIDHQVQYRGETLWFIASWYTGDGSNWKKILEANPDLNPAVLRAGNVVRIPYELVSRYDTFAATDVPDLPDIEMQEVTNDTDQGDEERLVEYPDPPESAVVEQAQQEETQAKDVAQIDTDTEPAAEAVAETTASAQDDLEVLDSDQPAKKPAKRRALWEELEAELLND